MNLKNALFTFLLVFSLITTNLKSQISTEQAFKFNRVMDLISMFYVDTIAEQKLVEKAIISVLKDLDPHSVYISKDDVKEMNEPLNGNFDGIGITYNILNDTAYVISTYHDGPSDKIGIKAGDRIIAIADENIAGIGIDTREIKEKLTGRKGTKIKLKIKRKNTEKVIDFSITRDKIPINSIDAAYIVNSDIAYIKLNKFSATTLQEFEKKAKSLKKEGAKNIILDLRDNGGGYLKTAIDIADQFLDSKKLIVYTKGLSSPVSEYYSSSNGSFEDSRLVILIDEGTASASEIVSGAIQDWDKGVIIGRRSFGKGLVQRPFYLMDGSMIRLTIARYYTPTGRLIQKTYEVGFDNYNSEIYQRLKNGELFNADSIHFADSLKFITLNNKRTVYGGGGIMPDIFVSADTTNFPSFYKKIIRNGILYEFILNKIDNNRENLLKKHPNFDSFKNNFIVDEQILKEAFEFCVINELENNLSDEKLLAIDDSESLEMYNKFEDYNFNNLYIKNHIKALIARDLWGTEEFYQIINLTDKTLLKAINVINDKKLYNTILSYN
ncbi:MAG: S41 family peptidase [Bacteroidales bacterium]|nr:S41 family peptidase [Bacteroidales bacterium]MBN2756613.1 S41 family peptidase [Bacteroidales bacterium]